MREITHRVVRHPRNRSWLAELEGQVVGSAGFERFEDTAVLVAGAVLPEARRRGIQTALVRHRLRAARAEGARVALVASTPGGPTERNALRAGFTVSTVLLGLEGYPGRREERCTS
jgi:GNAT superfamily N-acetyltransferase